VLGQAKNELKVFQRLIGANNLCLRMVVFLLKIIPGDRSIFNIPYDPLCLFLRSCLLKGGTIVHIISRGMTSRPVTAVS